MGTDDQSVRELLLPLTQSLGLTSFALFLHDSMAEVDLEAPAMLLDGDKVILNDLKKKDDFQTGKDKLSFVGLARLILG